MENLCRCLLPQVKWPSEPPRSKVRASKGNWWLIVERGLQLGLFGVVSDAKICRDDITRRIMDGAMAVTRTRRSSDGTEIQSQRFISVLVPTNAYSRCLRGDSKSLPIFSRVSQVMLGDDDWLSMDAQDVTPAFDLFEMPPSWVANVRARNGGGSQHRGWKPRGARPWNRSVPWILYTPWLYASLLSSLSWTQRQSCCHDDLWHKVTSQPITYTQWTSSSDSQKLFQQMR